MCTVLNADCFFSIVLSHFDEYEINDLFNLRDSVQSRYNDIVINLSGNAIKKATNFYAEYYSFNSESLVKSGSQSMFYFDVNFLKREFAEEVPPHVIEKIDTFISSIAAA